MSVYTYPAIFLEEPEGGYSIMFQNSLIGGGTQGATIEEGMEMAMELLAIALEMFFEENKKLPLVQVDSSAKALATVHKNWEHCQSLQTI